MTEKDAPRKRTAPQVVPPVQRRVRKRDADAGSEWCGPLQWQKAKWLLERIGSATSLTLTRQEVLNIATLLAVASPRAVGPRLKIRERDARIVVAWQRAVQDFGRDDPPRGWKSKMEAELAAQFHVDERTVRRAVELKAWLRKVSGSNLP